MLQNVAVRARGIGKSFGEVIAVDDVSLDIPAGEIHGLIGPNGAGKTTLLGMLLGLVTRDRGRLEVLGEPAAKAHLVPNGVAGFIDAPGLYPTLTARQNLVAVTRLRGTDPAAVAAVVDRVGLTDVIDDKVRGFSLGMRQRLGIAAALLCEPRLLVLDEPGNGLDPAAAREIRRLLRELAADGVCVVLSGHRMDELASLCAQVTLLASGRVVFSGSADKLVAESDPLDYRLLTSDPAGARRIAASTTGVRVLEAEQPCGPQDADALRVRASVMVLDDIVARLVEAGIGVRQLTPSVAPLEAAFLALTETAAETQIGPQ